MSDYRKQIVALLSLWIGEEISGVYRESWYPQANADASDDRIKYGKERVESLRRLRREIEDLD